MIEEKIVPWLREKYNLVVSTSMVLSIIDELHGVETEIEVRGRDAVTGIPQAILVLSEEVRAVIGLPS